MRIRRRRFKLDGREYTVQAVPLSVLHDYERTLEQVPATGTAEEYAKARLHLLAAQRAILAAGLIAPRLAEYGNAAGDGLVFEDITYELGGWLYLEIMILSRPYYRGFRGAWHAVESRRNLKQDFARNYAVTRAAMVASNGA